MSSNVETHFSADFFAGNRARLRERYGGSAPIVITANGLLQRGGDTPFPFQQDANFWYLTGIDEPNVTLVLEQDAAYLMVPLREGVHATFDGAIDTAALADRSGIRDIVPEAEGWRRVAQLLQKDTRVATLTPPPGFIEGPGIYTNPARARLAAHLHEMQPGLIVDDISAHIVALRMVKQPPEIAAIKQAIAITLKTMRGALRPTRLAKYAYEYEIEAALSHGFRSFGGRGHAFEPIVAAGANATTIHYLANNAPVAAGQLVVVDVGAEYAHYAADITRTIALGEPSTRQRQLFAAVQDVQQYAYSLLKPGVVLKAYEDQVAHYMGEQLRALGLITKNEPAQVRTYYPHATSHHLGLNVHDAADYRQPLAPNMVITVEPGIYVPEEGIGVRIEDDVRITKTGVQVLSRGLPARLN